MLLPKALKMRAVKHIIALVADSIDCTICTSAQMSWLLRHSDKQTIGCAKSAQSNWSCRVCTADSQIMKHRGPFELISTAACCLNILKSGRVPLDAGSLACAFGTRANSLPPGQCCSEASWKVHCFRKASVLRAGRPENSSDQDQEPAAKLLT